MSFQCYAIDLVFALMIKDLEIDFDTSISFNIAIEQMCTDIVKALGFIKRQTKYFNNDCIRTDTDKFLLLFIS